MRLLIAGAALICLQPASLNPAPVFRQDAYIWQRHWNQSLAHAVSESKGLVGAWRVLAAETDGNGHFHVFDTNWSQLAASGRALIPVFRIDGQLKDWDQASMLTEIDAILAGYRNSGLSLYGIEIDHDCATARLPEYARFLTALRLKLDPRLALSITTLPAWLDSTDLDAVIAIPDETVLQVHAVLNPHVGFFDPSLAYHWAEVMAARTAKPFRVSLPTYGTRVDWNSDGGIAAIESETPRFAGDAEATELLASPQSVSVLLKHLESSPPEHLAGVVWFRLPTDQDVRAWSLATWQAVVRGSLPDAAISVKLQASGTPGMSNVLVADSADTDESLPESVDLPRSCAVADGVNGYSLDDTGSGLRLTRLQPGLLHGHQLRLIGWARCSQTR